MTGRGHQLIHSDAFAAELEAMGLDQSIFGPHLPAPIFQALVPRKAGVFDEHAHTFGTGDEPATFARASDGIYLDADGDYKVAAAGAIRAEYDASGNFLGYLFEPAITNKCTNYNANPDAGLTNITKVGDAAAVVRRVLDVSELEAAGLSGICSSGYVFELDNSAGVSVAALQFGGATGNTNVHSGSAWCRYVSGSGQADLRMNDNAFITPFTNTNFQRVSGSGTPSLTTIRLRLQCAAGTVARIVVDQFEELPVITSPIITLGASGTRAIDTLSWAALPAELDQSQGTIILDFIPRWDRAEIAAGGYALISFSASVQPLYFDHGAGGTVWRITATDGTNFPNATPATEPVNGTHCRIALRWGSSTFQPMVWNSVDNAWATPTAVAYDGSFPTSNIRICNAVSIPLLVKNVAVWNRDLGTAGIERLFTPVT